jgi:hypothetical protein
VAAKGLAAFLWRVTGRELQPVSLASIPGRACLDEHPAPDGFGLSMGQQELAFGMSDIQQFAGADVMSANSIAQHAATKYAQRITACQRKSVESIIECGRLLIAAKDELKHGEFLKIIENNLPFKRSSAQAFMRIAKDKRIAKY